MSKIYTQSIPYRLTKAWFDFNFKLFYSDIVINGRENIPVDAPVIFAPNHTNALMDALAIAMLVKYPRTVVFLARADLFNNPKVAALMRFSKIMPAFRMRDGIDNLGKNKVVFDECVEVLHTNNTLCIMPEGNQEVERSIRPLVKGIFRIAFAAQKKYGQTKAVKIIPVGLDFGHPDKFGKHLLINIGSPMEVADYMAAYDENPAMAINNMRNILRDQLLELTFHLPGQRFYESNEFATKVLENPIRDLIKSGDCVNERFRVRRYISRGLLNMEVISPEVMQSFSDTCTEYQQLLKDNRLRTNWSDLKAGNLYRNLPILFIASPVFILGILLNGLPFMLPVWLRKYVLKTEFTGFYGSVQWSLGSIFFTFWYLISALLLLFHFGFFTAAMLIVLAIVSGSVAWMYYRILCKTIALIRLRRVKSENPNVFNRLYLLRQSVIDMFINNSAQIQES